MNKPFQRRDAESNTQVGRDFEAKAGQFFAGQGLRLSLGIEIPIGINGKKLHKFDLGDPAKKVIESGNFRRLGGYLTMKHEIHHEKYTNNIRTIFKSRWWGS